MNDRLSHRRRGSTSTLLTLASILVCLVFLAGMVAVGCGGADADTDTTTAIATSGDTTATTTAASDIAQMSGLELGEAVSTAWAEAIQDLNALLADLPEASSVQSQVETLKEEYIQTMLAFAERKQALDDAAKTEADAAIGLAVNSAGGTEWYATYATIHTEYAYSSGDVEFTNLLQSFSALTMYSDFDSLKAQDPAEATRLGIE